MHAGSINTAAAHHYNMDTDRSLLKHLLTAALVMFIIAGLTVTPIAAAECTGKICDISSYDVSVACDAIPEHATASVEPVESEDIDDTEETDTVAPLLALPVFCEIYIGDVLIVIATSVLLEIAGYLGLHWDEAVETWENFVLDVQDAINKLL